MPSSPGKKSVTLDLRQEEARQVYRDLVQDSWHARNWGDKLRVWLKPPGWRSADVAARFPKPAFELKAFGLYDPQASRTRQGLAAVLFLTVLGATSGFLWFAHLLSLPQQAGAAAGIVLLLWLVGWLCEPAATPAATPATAAS